MQLALPRHAEYQYRRYAAGHNSRFTGDLGLVLPAHAGIHFQTCASPEFVRLLIDAGAEMTPLPDTVSNSSVAWKRSPESGYNPRPALKLGRFVFVTAAGC